jgi:hypothetical protein
VLTPESVAFKAMREIRKDLPRFCGRQIAVSVNPYVAEQLLGPARKALHDLSRELGREIEVRAVPGLHQEQFEVSALDGGPPVELKLRWLVEHRDLTDLETPVAIDDLDEEKPDSALQPELAPLEDVGDEAPAWDEPETSTADSANEDEVERARPTLELSEPEVFDLLGDDSDAEEERGDLDVPRDGARLPRPEPSEGS